MEVWVNPECRRLRIGQRFYRKRQKLCQDFELKGIAFAGRMPGYSRRRKEFPDPHAYLEAVMEKRVRDSVLNFQMSQGYEPKEIIPDYLPSDKDSGGNAVLMFWSNPLAPQHANVGDKDTRTPFTASVRAAPVQST